MTLDATHLVGEMLSAVANVEERADAEQDGHNYARDIKPSVKCSHQDLYGSVQLNYDVYGVDAYHQGDGGQKDLDDFFSQ